MPYRALISGMFDMMNFGDLMFPIVAANRLHASGIEVTAISPAGGSAPLPDAMPTLSLRDMLTGDVEANGIVVGGGYVIHTHKLELIAEYRNTALAEYGGTGVWLGATLAAALRDIPVAWNALGVPHPLPQSQRNIIDSALRAADYVSVRDIGSKELLAAPENVPVETVPDPIATIADVWDRNALASSFKTLLERKGADSSARYIALHFRDRSLAKMSPADAALLIDRFCDAQDLSPLLIAVGQTHDDHIVARKIGAHIRRPHILLDDPASLKEIAAALAWSALYAGASLHGYVAAAAYGVPGVLVAQPSYRKFQGFLDHTGRNEDLARDWPRAFEIAKLRAGEKNSVRIPQSVFSALDTHWLRIAEVLADPDHGRMARENFLRAWLRAGIVTAGAEWAHLPFAKSRVVQSGSRGRGSTDDQT